MQDFILSSAIHSLDSQNEILIIPNNNDSDLDWKQFFNALTFNNNVTTLNLQNNKFGDRGTRSLSEALKVNTTLTSLYLDRNNIGVNGIEALSDALKVNRFLKLLDLGMNELDYEGIQFFSDALSENTVLETLIMNKNKIGESYDKIECFCKIFTKNFTIKNLILRNNDIDYNGLQLISKALLENNTLEKLDLRHNNIKSEDIHSLNELLKTNSTLRVLDIGNNSIGDEGVSYLSNSFFSPTNKLSKLNLKSNNIEDLGASFLSKSLKLNTPLIQLNLSRNNIGSKGAFSISESLIINNKLTILDLRYNSIKSEGAQYLSDALKNNKTLTILNLSWNLIDSNCGEFLGEALKSNFTLKSLNLSNNHLGAIGTQLLSDGIKLNNSLEELNLSENCIEDEGAEALSDSLRENSKLQLLNISGNNISDIGVQHICESLKVNSSLLTLNISRNVIHEDGIKFISESLMNNFSLSSLYFENNQFNEENISNVLMMIDVCLKKNKNTSVAIESKIQCFNKISKDANKIFFNFFDDIQNSIDEVKDEYLMWRSNYAHPSEDFLKSLNLEKLKLILEKLNKIKEYRSNLNDARKTINKMEGIFGSIEDLIVITNKIFMWIDSREKSLALLEQIKQKKDEIKFISNTLESKKLKLQLAKLENRASPLEISKLNSDINNEGMKLKDILNELIILNENIAFLKHKDLILESNNYGKKQHNEPKTDDFGVSRLLNFIQDNGKLSQLTFGDYNIISTQSNIIYATNINFENVVLKRIDLNSIYNVQKAWNEISLLIKLQNRPYMIPIESVLIETNRGITSLYIEMPDYGIGNLLHWIKKIKFERNVPYNGDSVSREETKQNFNSILRILLQIVESVSDLHSLGIEHRDLKPENILVDSLGKIKLIDFEFSKENNDYYQTMKRNFGNMTERYTPPEKKIPNQRSNTFRFGSWDIYSLGIIFYECLCDPRDIDSIDTLNVTNYSVSSILERSGNLMNDWIHKKILAMLHPDSSCRKSIYQLAQEIKDSLLDSHDELVRIFQIRNANSIEDLRASIQSPNEVKDNSRLEINEKEIVQCFTNHFNSFTSRSNILGDISTKFNGISGVGAGVFRDSLQLYMEALFHEENDFIIDQSNNPQLLTSNMFVFENGFFSPIDDIELKNEMEAFGRIIFHSIIKDYTLHLTLSPIIYCQFIEHIPKTTSGILNLLRRYDPQLISLIEQSLNDLDENNKDIAIESLENKKYILFGKRYRMKNIQHIKNGFLQFMNDREKLLLKNTKWDDIELLCCGPEIISSEMIFECMSKSLSSAAWDSSEESKRTKDWFKSWIQSQNSDGLRKFLQFATGLASIPWNRKDFSLNIEPMNNYYIRSATCFYRVKIGTSCKSKDELFKMMQVAIDSMGRLED